MWSYGDTGPLQKWKGPRVWSLQYSKFLVCYKTARLNLNFYDNCLKLPQMQWGIQGGFKVIQIPKAGLNLQISVYKSYRSNLDDPVIQSMISISYINEFPFHSTSIFSFSTTNTQSHLLSLSISSSTSNPYRHSCFINTSLCMELHSSSYSPVMKSSWISLCTSLFSCCIYN